MTKARIAISVDRPVRDVFDGLAPALSAPPAVGTPPDSFNVTERTAGQLIAVVARWGDRQLSARYRFATADTGMSLDCDYELTTRSMLGSLGLGGGLTPLISDWMQADMQRIPRAVQDAVKAEAERERAAQPAPGSADDTNRVTVRVAIKIKVQVPPGVKIDPSRIGPHAS